MKKQIIILISILMFSGSTGFAEKLGVNINLVEQGGTFVDMIKEHHRWLNPNTWGALTDDSFDEMGWPTTDAILMMDERPVAAWAGEIDDPEYYQIDRSGTYSGSFKGKAQVQSWGEGSVTDVVYNDATNTTTFKFKLGAPYEGDYGFMVLAFINTQRDAISAQKTGFTELELKRPGYPGYSDQIFIDELIEALTNPKFAAIRFKDFLGTDSCDPKYPGVTEWSDRSLPTHASQKRIDAINKRAGAAWEYVVELANLTKIDPWINIPVSATPEYITTLANFLKENLDPDLNIYVESSNEVWNTAPAFQQSVYNKAQAKALGIGEHENHARRTIEIAQLFESVYGDGSLNTKIRVILASHYPMLPWWVKPFVSYLQDENVDISHYVYALSCQSYFSGGADAGESVEKILQDSRDDITDQIIDSQTGRKKWIEFAKELNLVGGFCFYEGGPDCGGGSTTNIENRIEAERSEEMADVFKYSYDDGFFKLGGNLAIQFTLTSSYNRYGCWGLTDDITDPDRNYKFQAARDLINQPSKVESSQNLVGNFNLSDNYPNPFNPITFFEYEIPKEEHVKINIYNVLGAHVKTLVDQKQTAGKHQILFDATGLSTGVYFYELHTNSNTVKKECIYLK